MDTKLLAQKTHSNLELFLKTKVPGCVMGLLNSAPVANLNEVLSDEQYREWRDHFVHEYWMDKNWISREDDCPVEVLRLAHTRSILNNN